MGDNIKIDLGEIEWDCVDGICLAEDREKWKALVEATINF
jgi:hypothetical protein